MNLKKSDCSKILDSSIQRGKLVATTGHARS